MTEVRLTATAEADEAAILIEIQLKAGRRVAAKYLRALRSFYVRLSEFPESCPVRPALGDAVRVGIVFPFVILHRHDSGENVATVLRILDGRRHLSQTLLD
jgi:plasmid stabilization system protein ParE